MGKIPFPEVCEEVRIILEYTNTKKSTGENATILTLAKYTA